MKKITPVLLGILILFAAVLTAGFFNKAGNNEFYLHSLMSNPAGFYLDFEYGNVNYQSDPNNPVYMINPYPVPKNPAFEKTVSDYFKKAFGDRMKDSKDKAAAVLTVRLKGKSALGTGGVIETLDTALLVKLARTGDTILETPGETLQDTADWSSSETKGQSKYPKFTSGLNALLSAYVANNCYLADTLKKYTNNINPPGKVTAVSDPKKMILNVEYVSDKKISAAYKFVVIREKAGDVPETDWTAETKTWDVVAVLGLSAGKEPNTYSCKIQKIKAGMSPDDLVGLPVVLNYELVKLVLNAQDIMTGKDNWK